MPQTPKSAFFYSTIRSWGWGAPDYVWPRAALELRRRGIPVTACIRPQIRADQRIEPLLDAGVKFLPQPPMIYTQGRIGRLRAKISKWSPTSRPISQALKSAQSPHVFIDQGGSLDFLDESVLISALESQPTSYDVFFRSNNYSGPLVSQKRKQAEQFLANADRCLFNSKWTQEVTELQILATLPNAQIFTHLVRFGHQQPLVWPQGDTARLAIVNRIDVHHKGLDVLLQALSQIDQIKHPWTVNIYGKGPDEDYVKGLIAWLGLSSRVKMHAHVQDITTIWENCHMLLLTSRYEGLSVAMLEAMACGRPVLRTPYGGCSEWIQHGENGYVCPAAEPGLIASSIKEALAAFSHWPNLGLNAHRKIAATLPPDPESIYLSPFNNL